MSRKHGSGAASPSLDAAGAVPKDVLTAIVGGAGAEPRRDLTPEAAAALLDMTDRDQDVMKDGGKASLEGWNGSAAESLKQLAKIGSKLVEKYGALRLK